MLLIHALALLNVAMALYPVDFRNFVSHNYYNYKITVSALLGVSQSHRMTTALACIATDSANLSYTFCMLNFRVCIFWVPVIISVYMHTLLTWAEVRYQSYGSLDVLFVAISL